MRGCCSRPEQAGGGETPGQHAGARDELWVEETTREEDLYALAKERASIRFRRLGSRIIERFGRFEGCR